MRAIQEIRQFLSPELERVDLAIRQALDSSNALMNQVIYGYMRHKGKQIRPIMVLLTTHLFGGNITKAINSAAAIELLHNASLIHDDIVDNSASRHGNPTINAQYDPHVAVIVGDYFTSNALSMSLEDGDIRVPITLGTLGKLLTMGEMDQLETALNHSLSQDDYMKVITHKTASLFVACAEVGCYASPRAMEPQLQAMRQFAVLFGRAFQIRDDIFDYFDNAAVGKPTGQDLQEGKISLPLIHALSDSDAPGHDDMMKLAMKPDKSRDDIEKVITFAKERGGIEYATKVMHQMRDQARDIIKGLGDTDDLMALFDYVIDREN